MALVGNSGGSAFGIGPGNPIYFDVPTRHVAMQVITNGGVPAGSPITVDLEGTMDWGAHWTVLATVSLTEVTVATGASGFAFSANVPVVGIRANNTSPASGGTPAVFANLIGMDD